MHADQRNTCVRSFGLRDEAIHRFECEPCLADATRADERNNTTPLEKSEELS